MDIDIVAEKGSKPFVRYPITEIRFNISHSGNWVVIALDSEELGIDIEKINSSFDYAIILTEHFTSSEQSFIHNAENPSSAFYFLWTRKEALVKALGRGLQENLKIFSVLDGDKFSDEHARTWKIKSFNVGEEYSASLAYCSQPSEICFLDGSQLLS
jgi:4'-phosphopantetheinyl transferase